MTPKSHHSHSSLRDVLRPLALHLFAVLAIIMIASALGFMGMREKARTQVALHEQIASPTATESSPDAALFSVVVTEDVFCQNNVPLTTVGFLAVPPDGGIFHLVSSNGLDVPFTPGSYPLANGNYSWYVVPNSGLTASGPTSGTIALSGACGGATSSSIGSDPTSPSSGGGSSVSSGGGVATETPTVTPSAPSAFVATLLPRPVLKLFKDNIPLSEGSDAKGILELRVNDSDVKSVEFVSVQKEGTRTLLGKGTLDEFLSDRGHTVWAYFWDTASTSGEYKVSGVVTHSSGVVTETLPVSVSLVVTPSLTLSGTPLVKPDSTDTPSALLGLKPDRCTSEAECRAFCGSTKEHYDACMTYVRAPVGSMQGNGSFFAERVGARLFIDSDGDGIRDYDEVNLYGTDPGSKDTDKDGFPDDRELLGATNPRGGTTTGEALVNLNSDIVQSSESLENIVPIAPSLALLHVGMTKDDGASSSSPVEIIATGHALPNSFVTLFIFSRPFTAVVRTDNEGNFTYTLPQELADGTHHIYATISALNGTPLLRSDGYVFVKSGSHVGRTHVLPISAAHDVDMQIALFDSSLVASFFLFTGLLLFACAFWWRNRAPAHVLDRQQKHFGHVVYLK